MKLTKREKWLMAQAYQCGSDFGAGVIFDQWLNDQVDDQGHTVEDWLAGSAPEDKEDGDG